MLCPWANLLGGGSWTACPDRHESEGPWSWAQADTSKDGAISYEEFIDYLQVAHPWWLQGLCNGLVLPVLAEDSIAT